MDQNTLVRNNITGTFLKDIEEIAAAPIDWSMLEGKSITITGASGFISSHLVLSLLLRNDDYNSNIKVIGLVRSMERAEKKYGNLLGREDLILVEQQNTASNGDIVVAMIDGFESEATVKTFYREKDHIRLQPENDTMSPIIVRDVSIQGKVKGVFRYFS